MHAELVQHEHLTRQMDIIPVKLLAKYPIHIIGCGAIGSYTAMALAKMGVTRLHLYDMDTVDIVNMNCQLHRFKDIGKNKAAALADVIEDFTGVKLWYSMSKVEPVHVSSLGGIVIMAVDRMDTRKQMYLAIRDEAPRVKYIVDPRMGAEFYVQYTMDPHDDKDQGTYIKTLHSDRDGVQEPCTAKSTVYTATLASGLVCKTVKDLLLGGAYPRVINWSIAACDSPMLMHPGSTNGPE